MSNPRIVIGCAVPLKVAGLVAEYSILKHCPDAEVVQVYHRPFLKPVGEGEGFMGCGFDTTLHRDRWEGEPEWLPVSTNTGTLFSLCRHMVPEICGFEGRAIYMDCDKIVFDDISKVWNLPMDDFAMLRLKSGQFSVMLMDCGKLKPYPVRKLLEDRIPYRQLIRGEYLPEGWIGARIPNEWNCLDQHTSGTKLLHYTCMQTQPWAKPGHKFGHLWFDMLAEAIREGFLSLEDVTSSIRKMDRLTTWQAAMRPQPHVLEELQKRDVA